MLVVFQQLHGFLEATLKRQQASPPPLRKGKGGTREGRWGCAWVPLFSGTQPLARLKAVGKALPELPFQASESVLREGRTPRWPCQRPQSSREVHEGAADGEGGRWGHSASSSPRLIIQRVPPKSDRAPVGEFMYSFDMAGQLTQGMPYHHARRQLL